MSNLNRLFNVAASLNTKCAWHADRFRIFWASLHDNEPFTSHLKLVPISKDMFIFVGQDFAHLFCSRQEARCMSVFLRVLRSVCLSVCQRYAIVCLPHFAFQDVCSHLHAWASHHFQPSAFPLRHRQRPA